MKKKKQAKGSSPSVNSPTLDLHGKRTEEVLPLLDQFLNTVSRRGVKQARVMTGKGTGVVQSEVIRLLKQAHYPWKYERLSNGAENSGVLIVFVSED